MTLNLNVGILGHVDSGKTSLAKRLSDVASTAAFDKDPQSQSRGITLDLGFSSFSIPTPPHLKELTNVDKFQYTLVDCPGHASLIKTVIGGAQIIDIILLVIDITKGIQTQTAECLVIGEITCTKMIVVLNKIDLLPADKRDKLIEKMRKKITQTLNGMLFSNSPIVTLSATSSKDTGISNLIDAISHFSFIPERESSGPFLFAVDHCFSIKGQGTVLTGTVLKGHISNNDVIEVPTMKIERKIKSIQIFRKPVTTISQGDRAGICVTQFDAKLFERGLICSPNNVKFVYCCIASLNRIKYFKYPISSKSKLHITIGHGTTIGTVTIFTSKTSDNFTFQNEYEYVDSLDPISKEINTSGKYFMLIEFDKPTLVTENSLIIVSKLDLRTSANTCRIALWSNLLDCSKDIDYKTSLLPKLKVFKTKSKIGMIDRVVNDNTIIVRNMFKKETQLDIFIGLQVKTSLGDIGKIESAFGKSGKIRVCFEKTLNDEILSLKDPDPEKSKIKIEVLLTFKKYIYDVNKRILQ